MGKKVKEQLEKDEHAKLLLGKPWSELSRSEKVVITTL